MKYGKPLLFLLLSMTVFSTNAREFVMSYDGFYDRLKIVNKGEFQYARVNFYISDIRTGKKCSIESGTILTENNEYPLNYTQEAQLLLPFDKQLNTDKAVIVIQPQDPLHECQLKLQIEANELNDLTFNKHALYTIHNELDELLTDLSGFFVSKLMWFLLPQQKGVVVTFKTPQHVDVEGVYCEDSKCYFEVLKTWKDDKTLLGDFSQVVKVTPWIKK